MKKLKLLGVPALILAGLATLFTPSPADARVRVEIGAPYYTYYPYYPYGYVYVGPHGHYYYHHYRHWR
jgi:hypothetical protein